MGFCGFLTPYKLLYHALMTRVVDGHAVCCICTKNIDNCRKDEELIKLLRSYDKQNSINAMKKKWSSAFRLG